MGTISKLVRKALGTPKTRGKNQTVSRKTSEAATPLDTEEILLPSLVKSGRTKNSKQRAEAWVKIKAVPASKRTPEQKAWLGKYELEEKLRSRTALVTASQSSRGKSRTGIMPTKAKKSKEVVDTETGEVLDEKAYDALTTNQKAALRRNADARGRRSGVDPVKEEITRRLMSGAVEKRWRKKMGEKEFRAFMVSMLRKRSSYKFDPADAAAWMKKKGKK